MKKIILLFAISTIVFSCKKDNIKPSVVAACSGPTVITDIKHDSIYYTIHDTLHSVSIDSIYSVTHDSVFLTAVNLIGLWNCYRMETRSDGGSTSVSQNVGMFDFTFSSLKQDLDLNGSYEVVNNVTYNTNYLQVHYSQGTQLYVIEKVGSEFRLTRQSTQTQSQVWFLRK